MDLVNTHALQPFWSMAAAPVQVSALELALDNKLFDYLVQDATAKQVASKLAMQPGPVSVWLDLLWSMELLARNLPPGSPGDSGAATHYQCTSLAKRYLVSSSPENCAAALSYRLRILRHAGTQFEDFVRSGRSERTIPGGEATHTNWAKAAEQQISQEQRAVSVPSILDRLPPASSLVQQGRFLDLGGGPGHIAIALAHHLPQWTGTVCDLPATATVAQGSIDNAGLADRINVRSADLEHDDIGTGYDLIWCSCVLHFLQDPKAALSKICQGLRRGGVLYIAHAEVPSQARDASRILPFYASMMLRGRFVPATGQMHDMLVATGFSQIRSLGPIAFPMTPVWLYTGIKP
ncbi:methyltransferase [Advenella sp. S44]|nr:methyltransferase [Advenella sp. S44]